MAETSIDISTGGVTQSIVAFDAICMIVDLTCIGYTAALVHRGRGRPRTLPLWTTLSCLIAWILYLAFDVIEFVTISTNQDPSSVISSGGQNAFITGFQWLATCLTFHVLYALIHLMLDQTQPVKSKSKSNTPWRKTRVFHRVFFAVIVVAACLSFAMLCAMLYFAHPLSAYGPIQGVGAIVAWIASIENMAWSIHVGVRYPRCLGGHILPTLLLITAATFWSISNCLIAIEISFTCLVTDISARRGTIFDMSLIAGGSFRILIALSRIMYWAAIVVFCFRYSSIQSEGVLGSENDEALDSLNQKQDDDAGVEVQMVCYEADSKAYIAELPGDYNQVCEAESHQIAEMGESEKFELPDFQSLDVKEKENKDAVVTETVKI